MQFAYANADGASSLGQIGVAAIARDLIVGAARGYWSSEVTVPAGFPTNAPTTARVLIAPVVGSTSGTMQIELRITQARAGVIIAEHTILTPFTRPPGWNPPVATELALVGGGSSTLAPGTLAVGDVLGCSLRRRGDLPTDTYNNTVRVAVGFDLR